MSILKVLVKILVGVLLVVALFIPTLILMLASVTSPYILEEETKPPVPEGGLVDSVLKKTLYPFCELVFEKW